MASRKPFEISDRPCMIDNVNLRTEKHGDDNMPAVDVKLSGLVLDKAELKRLTGDSECWNLMFETGKGGVIEPTQQYFEGERFLAAKFEKCRTTLRFGMQKTEYELDGHKIKGIVCKALSGGMTSVTLTIQHALEDTKITAQLHEYQQHEAHAAITFGEVSEKEKRQGSLALNEGDRDDDGAGESAGVH